MAYLGMLQKGYGLEGIRLYCTEYFPSPYGTSLRIVVLRCHPRRHSAITLSPQSPWNWRWCVLSWENRSGYGIGRFVVILFPSPLWYVLWFWESFSSNFHLAYFTSEYVQYGSQLNHFRPIYPFFKNFQNLPKQAITCFSGALPPDSTGPSPTVPITPLSRYCSAVGVLFYLLPNLGTHSAHQVDVDFAIPACLR